MSPRAARVALVLAGSLLATTPALADRSGPKVRDHRSDNGAEPKVRDHRSDNGSEPKVRDHRSEPKVRDHRSTPASSEQANVRDHRSEPETNAYIYDGPGVTRARARLPLVMLPLKLDIGAAGAATPRGLANGIGGSLGIHWASLAPRPTDTDVGVGVFGSVMMSVPDNTSVMDDRNEINQLGLYVELGRTLSRSSHTRTWASGRGEYLSSRAYAGKVHTGFGASARLSAELYTSAAVANRNGVFLGTWAIGLYAEAALRDTAMDAGRLHAGVGMTFRTPLVLSL